MAPEVGREFTDDEDRVNGPAVAVLSHALWVRAFNADPSIVGRSITLRGEPHTVVGVMPAAFHWSTPVDVWTPLRPSPQGEGSGENYGLHRAAQGRRHLAAGDRADRVQRRPTLARERYRSRRDDTAVRIRRRAAAARADRRLAPSAADPLGRGRRRAADRLREHRRPAGGARRRARAGDCDAHRARRQPRRHRPAAARRERRAGGVRRRGRARDRLCRVAVAGVVADRRVRRHRRHRTRRARAGDHERSRALDERRVRPAPGAAGEPRRSAPRADRIRRHIGGGRGAQLAATADGDGGSRARRRAAGRRRPADPIVRLS